MFKISQRIDFLWNTQNILKSCAHHSAQEHDDIKIKILVPCRWYFDFESLSSKENGKNIDAQNNPHKMHFWRIFKNCQISSVVEYLSVD